MSISKDKRTPSLQHLVKQIGGSPDLTARNIIKLRDGGPSIRTFEARNYHRSRLKGMALEQVLRQAACDPRKEVARTAEETLPLLEEYISLSQHKWFRETGEYVYQVGAGLVLPVKGLGVIGVDGKRKLLCVQLWKGISLSAAQFNMWAGFFKLAVMDRDPDIEDFDWLEMSIPKGGLKRELRIRSLDSARLPSETEMREIHEHIAAAMLIVENTPRKRDDSKKKPDQTGQRSFFEDDEDGEK